MKTLSIKESWTTIKKFFIDFVGDDSTSKVSEEGKIRIKKTKLISPYWNWLIGKKSGTTFK